VRGTFEARQIEPSVAAFEAEVAEEPVAAL
jgi:hypothetical protein